MILVMSGTKDGRELIEALSAAGHELIATTTTAYGGSLIEARKGVRIIDYALDSEALISIIDKEKIRLIVDATHPYATGASENAMRASAACGIQYVRYERETLDVQGAKWFDAYEEILRYLSENQGNILLTIGANNLKIFSEGLDLERLYARVLPMSNIISKCENLGMKTSHIIGVQGPFSKAYNMAMIDTYNIKYMVSKATAKTGGFDQKVLACEACGIELLVLKRPEIKYDAVYTSIGEVMDYVDDCLMIDRF